MATWKKQASVADLPIVSSELKSTVLSGEDEAIVIGFRRHTLLPLDHCLYSLQAKMPQLMRSSLHRRLQRHGFSKLPDTEGDKPDSKVQGLSDWRLPHRQCRGAGRTR
ncbi:hypothetical protein LVY75_04715 (plasmid) [Sinorhizobium sp. B11]